MKRILLVFTLLAACLPNTYARKVLKVTAPQADHVTMEKESDRLSLGMEIDLTTVEVESNRAVLLTPVLVNGAQQVQLPAVGIYGRKRYLYYLRNDGSLLTGNGETTLKAADKPARLTYRTTTAWQEWMDGATLELRRDDYGCCQSVLADDVTPLRLFELEKPFVPRLAYVCPVAETVKSRSVSGHAFIDFPVNKTVIYPDYRGNQRELAKIVATIDSVKNDRDITVTSLSIKGFASPEGSYANNTRLAQGRTEALKEYVRRQYSFPSDFIRTSFEPEDWEGLRRYVEGSGLTHRNEILNLIDSAVEPDRKEARLKSTYPDEYRHLLADVYPGLRHSDYTVAFEVRGFTDVEEIKRLVKSQPQKLSLNEFYLAAQAYEPGSDEFNEVFETAVRMYPDDAAANLNAANAALTRGDTRKAEAYLKKADDGGEALYARGVMATNEARYAEALQLMQQAAQKGIGQAEAAIIYLTKRIK